MEHQILCIGELLIDFICSDVNVSLDQGVNFLKKAGGAPANVAAAIARLGGRAVYAGKVGADAFGKFLKNSLVEVGVDTSQVVEDPEHSTTLAFVSLQSSGERDFMFNRGADAFHRYGEVDQRVVSGCGILHFGSATALLGGDSRDTYLRLMREAKGLGRFVSFDPNYRGDLWQGRLPEFIDLVKDCTAGADLVKMSDEEIRLVSGREDLEGAVRSLHGLGARAVAVTLGKEGVLLSNGVRSDVIPSMKITSIDSTGAGDAFVGGFLYQVSKLAAPRAVLEDFETLAGFADFANRVGAIVCTKLGALAAMPTPAEVAATYPGK